MALKNTHPSHNFALFSHADVVFTLFSFYSNVAPKGFCLDNKESWKQKKKVDSGKVMFTSYTNTAQIFLSPTAKC